ncbi:iron-containing redox enzyme family protein [Pseudomonas sp. HR96]|uniref:iron-containing redox enzyme family protein n=1 Tax=Pseudomonas sp. HR96 TaxID=1027966 RepID=UPI002A74D1E5|nr:iron-containing redox enzyme family protein [Pseudomonas sp. HR96]WPO98174.1 iron-containing redox enzyme family protein [Pseudomonas sp. HR96]
MTHFQSLQDATAQPALALPAAQPFYEAVLHTPEALPPAQLDAFLGHHLQQARQLPCDMPEPEDLLAWVNGNAEQVAERYAEYLEQRHAGAPRGFFSSKAHALYFLRHVAPSKLVDGAWLYGTLRHADDWRFHGLIRTYLEELGDGDPALNHVSLYRKLLAEHDCAATEPLADELYLQGALQLALGQAVERFLPEVLGYNLGYEQLPLHLLISAFELNELGIDPYYFTLHVTVDNASSGHAHKALAAVHDLLPNGPERAAFIERLRAGYLLNELGVGSMAVIEGFDLEREVVAMLERKRSFGQHMHSDYCRLQGRTVNQWLAEPGQSLAFLAALEEKGWIKRNADPAQSRFWQLIDGPGAAMFGVFSGYEMQLLHDWIAGDWQAAEAAPFRAQFRRRARGPALPKAASATTPPNLEQLAPACHATPPGLLATQAFSRHLHGAGMAR